MKVTAILTAAGTGSRFKNLSGSNSNTPKQFLSLFNKPVILYSLLAFQKCKSINKIIIASSPENFELIHNITAKNKISKLYKLVEGGKTRAESVKNAFYEIEDKSKSLVLIHDAARPNITVSLLNNIIAQAEQSGSVILGNRISETIKRTHKDIITGTVDRNNLWAVQTPQVFPYKVLDNSYLKLKKSKKLSMFTDESSIVENAGFKVKIMEGSKDNIKITTPEDIQFLKKLMK